MVVVRLGLLKVMASVTSTLGQAGSSASLLFRAYVHGAPGYATLSLQHDSGSVLELKEAALKLVMKRVQVSTAVVTKNHTEEEDEGVGSLPLPGDSGGDSGEMSASAGAPDSIASASAPAGVNVDEEISNGTHASNNVKSAANPNNYFVRIMWSSNDRFATAIEACASDDDILCAEATKWIVGNDAITTTAKCYKLWRRELKTRIGATGDDDGDDDEACAADHANDDHGAGVADDASDESAIDARSGGNLKSERSHSADMPRAISVQNTFDDDVGHYGDKEGTHPPEPLNQPRKGTDHTFRKSVSQGGMPVLPPVAIIELVPRALVPPAATNMRVSVKGYFSCKDMYDKTFHKYEIAVSTGDLEWTLSKRYREFAAFHADLRDAWMALSKSRRRELRQLPRIPPKKILGSTKTRFLTTRKRGLERFLRLLTVHPWASEQVSFLSFTGMLSDTRTCEAAEGRNVIHLSRILDFVKVR